MDLLTSLKISSSGLSANSNAQTTRTPEGGPYRRKKWFLGAEPARQNFSDILEGTLDNEASEVHVTEVASSNLRLWHPCCANNNITK